MRHAIGGASGARARVASQTCVSTERSVLNTRFCTEGLGLHPGARSPASQTWLPHTAARATRRTPASRNSWLPAAAPRASSSARVAADARRSCRGLQTLC